ncbi:MAG TPA: membrane protein insertase YidC [Thermoguttaceae bacterium]|nr:membrane protein insertase YidC [Thermoguttaceae bacterium]
MQEQSGSKPSNLVLFIILTFVVLMVHSWITRPKPEANKPVADAKAEVGKKAPVADEAKAVKPDKKTAEEESAAEPSPEESEAEPEEEEEGEELPAGGTAVVPEVTGPPKYYSIGSADPNDPYRMLVTLTDRGAAVARIELNSPRYPALMDDDGDLGPEGYLAYTGGYLGRVALDCEKMGKGCQVQAVGRGTPAEKAGLKPGDVITKIDGKNFVGAKELNAILAKRKPGRTVELEVARDGKKLASPLKAKLTRPPMQVVRPENGDPLSFLMTLSRIDNRKLPPTEVDPSEPKNERPLAVDKELKGLNLRGGTWKVAEQGPDRIAFRCELPRWGLEVVKIYRLEPVPKDKQADPDYPAYNLILDVKVGLLDGEKKTRAIAYQLDGPTGLPIEGWWYANKVARCWSSGLRDVIISRNGETPGMVGGMTIASDKVQDFVLHYDDKPMTYIGVDAQYFAAILIPRKSDPADLWFATSQPLRVGKVDPNITKIVDVTCRMRSVTAELTPDGKPLEHSFTVFAGPKRPEIIAPYGLSELVYYGWPIYDFTARPMAAILAFFHRLVGNYGLAILLLTVLVRGLMYPMSRKQVIGAQKMAELQPEMKKIQEKYKKDMEARTRAQQELFKKHKYNPMSGCLVMFVQLPIFIGLYRALMVNVELRGSPLLGWGLRWCSNLSAPDMLIDWHKWLPGFFTEGISMFSLGPYFNLLPIATIVLFLLQQKMFMPPPVDDQQKMQQNMMKYMMLFMGLMFFKVASGLCVYFIASSLWGLAERKLLPKTAKKDDGTAASQAMLPKKSPDAGGNGTAKKSGRDKFRRRK